VERIAASARKEGCAVGFDLDRAAGNVPLALHDWGPDFAVWCSYKYLNGGPGAVAGAFVHERHARARTLPRLAGWWSERLTGYAEWLLQQLPANRFCILTPSATAERGAQLSLQIASGRGREVLARLSGEGVICDFREPDILRVAPVPLYNRFLDVYRFVQVLEEVL
jgi:kynureninase